MASYIVPQVLINQLISEVSLNTVKNQNVLVIGPSYELFRFAEEKEKTYIGTYDRGVVKTDSGDSAVVVPAADTKKKLIPASLQSQGVIAYPGLANGTTPDASYTKVFADDVTVELVELGDFDTLPFDEEDPSVSIRFPFALTGKNSGCEVAIELDSNDKPVAAAFVVDDEGKKNVIKDIARGVNPGDAIRIVTDDVVYQSVILSVFESVKGSGIEDCVVLADSFPAGIVENGAPVAGAKVSLCAIFSDVEVPEKQADRNVYNWATYADTEVGNVEDVFGVIISDDLEVVYSNWGKVPVEKTVISAKLYVQHRDLNPSAATDITSIASSALVGAALGTVHPDNPLAFGVYMAALNSGDRLVYYVSVPTDDLAGYNYGLERASLSNDVYIICPTTMDLTVIQAVKAHCLEMSTAENKLWRIGFVSIEPPAVDIIYDRTNTPNGDDFYARVYAVSEGKPINLVQFMASDDPTDDRVDTTVKCLTDVQVGDVVRLYFNDSQDDWDDTPHFTECRVKKVVSNTILQLSDALEVCGDVCVPGMIPAGHTANTRYKVEVVRKLTPTQQVKYIARQSSQMATRRIYNVFPSIASNDGLQFSGEFLACAAAGIVSSVLPQQPVTNIEVNGVNDIPLVYQTYSRAQLNEIAAGGTFIIMQDLPNSKVYIRHQISTDYTSNNLLRAELSITKNLDSISYYFAEIFAPYIGKYNITPELIDVLEVELSTGLSALETGTGAGLYGPQVLADGTDILYIRQSEANRDHVEARVHLNLPVPFNFFDLDLEI